MGSVDRRQLSLASAFLGTMRVTGMALSVALLGGIAASQLGRLPAAASCTRTVTNAGQSFDAGGPPSAGHYATGYKYAMLTGAALAVLARSPH